MDWTAKRSCWLMALVLLLGQIGCSEPMKTPDLLVNNAMLRQRGYDAINAGDLPGAREQFTLAVERKPGDAIAWYYLGTMQLKLDQPLDAELSLGRALALEPADAELTPRILNRLAQAIYVQKRYDNLVTFLEETAQESNLTSDYLRQAHYLVKLGDPDGAVVAYRKGAFFAPLGDAQPYVELADYYLSINDTKTATLAMRYAYHENPDYPSLANRFRQIGLVPGPTLGIKPPKPQVLDAR